MPRSSRLTSRSCRSRQHAQAPSSGGHRRGDARAPWPGFRRRSRTCREFVVRRPLLKRPRGPRASPPRPGSIWRQFQAHRAVRPHHTATEPTRRSTAAPPPPPLRPPRPSAPIAAPIPLARRGWVAGWRAGPAGGRHGALAGARVGSWPLGRSLAASPPRLATARPLASNRRPRRGARRAAPRQAEPAPSYALLLFVLVGEAAAAFMLASSILQPQSGGELSASALARVPTTASRLGAPASAQREHHHRRGDHDGLRRQTASGPTLSMSTIGAGREGGALGALFVEAGASRDVFVPPSRYIEGAHR